MRHLLALALAPLALAACSQRAETPAPVNNSAAAVPQTGYIAKVQALPSGQREGVLFRAIKKGGGASCQGVDKVETLAPTKDGRPNWRVTCPDASQWLVTLSDDGIALVTGSRGA